MRTKALTDQTYDVLYEELLEAVGIEELDMVKYSLSQVGFLRPTDLVNKQVAISNNNLFYLCNSLPAVSSSYIPSGDLINSYALFLDYLVPKAMSNDQMVQQTALIHKKNEIENQIHRIIPKKNSESKNMNIASLLEKIKAHENNIAQIIKSGSTVISNIVNPDPSLTTARASVSFLTGARKIDGKNSYNMPVNTNPPEPLDSYSPGYEIMGLNAIWSRWKKNKNSNHYPHIITISNTKTSKKKKKAHILPVSTLKVTYGSGTTGRSLNTTEKDYEINEIRAAFSGLGNFLVKPVNWLYPSFFKSTSYTLLPEAPGFFQKGGALEAITFSLLLGYNLNISIRMEKKTYENLNNLIGTSGKTSDLKITISKFQFTVTGSRKDTTLKVINETQTIQLSPMNAGLPNLLGVISKKTTPFIQGTESWDDSPVSKPI